jgi:cellulose synthase/poly-beta-1,6-N-acetylglucosamine synthase-like glycosyltransferase/peptidoglycan/xylan/chitin deacetylase (PgdA/CDA1 family)/spore germination protein YaaH
MNNANQIFQTNSALRWNSVKWTTRVILFIAIFFITVVSIAIVQGTSPNLTNIESKNRFFKDVINPIVKRNVPFSQRNKTRGFKAFLEAKDKEDSINKIKGNKPIEKIDYIRAAFYDPSESYAVGLNDLETNGNKLNTIFPEWFFIDPMDHSKIISRIDSAGLAIMRKYNLKILPMLTNYNPLKRGKPDFDGGLLHETLIDSVKRNKFINNLADTISKYKLQGINIDFEEIAEATNEPLNNFQEKLYEVFHAKGLLVTQDVIPMNEDYDYEELNKYNDHIVLMAYDQFSDAQSGPGPVSAQKWIEGVLDDAAKKIESSKIILGLAGYGRDWSVDNKGNVLKDENGIRIEPTALTYSQALDKARLSGSNVIFDNDNFNLHYSYAEQAGDEIVQHIVWFTGAVSSYNIMRFADEYATAGTALWVMGKEDRRLWNFYGRSLSNAALHLKPFNYNTMLSLPYDVNQKPTPVGEGELLRILYTPQTGKAKLEIDSSEQLISEQTYLQLPSGYVYEKFGEDTTPIGPGHKMILTFDDGPSSEWTPKILDILEKEKVPATFFIVGINAENHIPLLQRIYQSGFEIGNHTFTHNNIAKMSPQRAELEMKSTRLLIEAVTGRSTILFRAPFNADSEPQTFEEIEPIARSKKENYITVGESIDPQDWDDNLVNADSIFNRTVRLAESGNANIILLHDAGGKTREATVEALPRIIKYFKDKGCNFTTVADLMGKTRNDVMPAVKRNLKLRFDFYFSMFIYWASHFIFALFLVGIFLSMSRILLMGILAFKQKRREKNLPVNNKQPGVSIIVPAYNEEVNAVRTVESLLQQDYPGLQIIFVDDGSRDETFKKVSDFFSGVPNVQVVSKQNGGKATALNFGINLATNDYVVCIDADTQLKKDSITQLMKKFYALPGEAPVGAVAGNVKVGNEINMITRWQSIEYTTSQNFDRSAFDLLNCITVVPGAIGAFKKSAVIEAGGFTSDTLAEDCDLTMRLHKRGYRIRNCRQAISYTEAPETFSQFLKQRFRWSFGVMQSFWKHRDAFLNPRYRNFGMVALPHILVYQMLLPFLAPLADLILIFSLIASGMGIIPANPGHIMLYYFIFTSVDIAGAAIAFNFENTALREEDGSTATRPKEDYRKLWRLFPQQLVYRQLMYYILFKSFNKALKGEMQGWGVLKRTGNVPIPAENLSRFS